MLVTTRYSSPGSFGRSYLKSKWFRGEKPNEHGDPDCGGHHFRTLFPSHFLTCHTVDATGASQLSFPIDIGAYWNTDGVQGASLHC